MLSRQRVGTGDIKTWTGHKTNLLDLAWSGGFIKVSFVSSASSLLFLPQSMGEVTSVAYSFARACSKTVVVYIPFPRSTNIFLLMFWSGCPSKANKFTTDAACNSCQQDLQASSFPCQDSHHLLCVQILVLSDVLRGENEKQGRRREKENSLFKLIATLGGTSEHRPQAYRD